VATVWLHIQRVANVPVILGLLMHVLAIHTSLNKIWRTRRESSCDVMTRLVH